MQMIFYYPALFVYVSSLPLHCRNLYSPHICYLDFLSLMYLLHIQIVSSSSSFLFARRKLLLARFIRSDQSSFRRMLFPNGQFSRKKFLLVVLT